MKKIISTLSLALFVSSSTAFASSKVCFGSTKDEDTKGVVLKIQVDVQTISTKVIQSSSSQIFTDDYYNNGNYPTYGSQIKGRDGKVYLEYKGENSDYQDVILVDEALLESGTTGLLQIRARGEGFFNSVFVCKDDRP